MYGMIFPVVGINVYSYRICINCNWIPISISPVMSKLKADPPPVEQIIKSKSS